MAELTSAARSGERSSSRRRRRQQKRRAREMRRLILGAVFVALEITGFCLANFASRDSWAELIGFLLLQPVQIVLNLLDSSFRLTRGVRDADAVLLVTLISLSLNALFWYAVWRGWRRLRRMRKRRQRAAGAPYGTAPLPSRMDIPVGSPADFVVLERSATETTGALEPSLRK